MVYTQNDIGTVAHTLLGEVTNTPSATIVGLSGDLGAGKTTLVQAIGKSLGVVETITSPTFVIAKYYDTSDTRFTKLIHIDAYRIEDPKELEVLGWEHMQKEPNTLIVIEWPEKVEEILPKETRRFLISHQHDQRHIKEV